MSFSASQKNINEVFSRNTIYIIPKNQRKYVWGETEWNELFEDLFLIDQSQNYNHFLGSIVLAKEGSKNQYSIIDGQQRFTTISILILSIINQLYKISEEKVANSYKNTFLKCNNDGEECYKIERKDGSFYLINLIEDLNSYKNNEEVKKLFEDIYGKNDRYNEKLLECFLWFNNKFESTIENKDKKKDFIVSLKDKLINSELIEIIVEKDVDGYRVFETLNARGIPLEQHELIKNYLYSYLRKKAQAQKLDNLWAKIINNITFNDTDYFPAFISHYCTHIYGKTKKNEEFKTIRANTFKTKTEELLVSLHKNSMFYSYILEPTRLKGTEFYDERIVLSLKYFKDLNIRQVRPLLLSLFEKCDEKVINMNEFQKCVELVEIFYFLYSTVLKNTTNAIDNTIIELSKSIHSSNEMNYSDLIKDKLKKFVSEKAKIKENFKYIGFSNKNKKFKNSSNKRTVNYIFTKFEHYYDENNELEPKISSIEHILGDSDENDKTCYIGNLLPLSSRLNNKISSKPYKVKIQYYKKSKLLSVVEFLKSNENKADWGDNDIEERGKNLADIAFSKIWLFD